MINQLQIPRDQKFQSKHDPIYASLDRIKNWFIYGHLSFLDDLQRSEAKRVKCFHLLIKDLARRFHGNRDLQGLGWFLKQEGWEGGKRFHFHFALTDENLTSTTPEVACRFIAKQWAKITGATAIQVEQWNHAEGANGIWYLTEYEDKPPRLSGYFDGELCHYKISKTLHKRILETSTQG